MVSQVPRSTNLQFSNTQRKRGLVEEVKPQAAQAPAVMIIFNKSWRNYKSLYGNIYIRKALFEVVENHFICISFASLSRFGIS